LIEILAEAALDDLLHEQAGLDERPSRGHPQAAPPETVQDLTPNEYAPSLA
jgi:hypothetical protein